MGRSLAWYDHIPINIFWLGINVVTGTVTLLLLPHLVGLYVPEAQKNTYLAAARLAGLVLAMVMQPLSGMLSDRSTLRWGRRRPYILAGAAANVLFLVAIGASAWVRGSAPDRYLQALLGISAAYLVVLAGSALLQGSNNFAHGATQGLIPDLVPENQRGRSSAVKAMMELLPAPALMASGVLVGRGLIWPAIGLAVVVMAIPLLLTLFLIREEPLRERPSQPIAGRVLRLLGLAAIFVGITQGAIGLVSTAGTMLARLGSSPMVQVLLVAVAGLAGMAGSILLGVYLGAWVGIGPQARQQTSFIWWVVNRLLFLAPAFSLAGFFLYYLRDVLRFPDAGLMTTILIAGVTACLIPAALLGGYMADRVGRRRLVGLAGLMAAAGTTLFLLSRSVPLVIVSSCIIGSGTGLFLSTSWALGTDLAPPAEAGRYLGISNLAGAGAGIVGTGIGGPLVDFFNGFQPGLGYAVIFGLYGMLFLLSMVPLLWVREARPQTQ